MSASCCGEMALTFAAASAAASLSAGLALRIERQRGEQRRLGVLEHLRRHRSRRRPLRSAGSRAARTRLSGATCGLAPIEIASSACKPGALLDALLARQLGGKTGAGRIAGDGRAEAGDERGVGLHRLGELRRGAARLAPSRKPRSCAPRPISLRAARMATRRIAGRHVGERLGRLLQQARAVEDLQAQREELLVGDAAVGRRDVGSDEPQP